MHPDCRDPTATARYRLVPSPFGDLALLWQRDDVGVRLRRVLLPGETAVPSASPGSCAEIDDLAARLERYFSGEAVSFPLDRLMWKTCSPFQRRVLRAEAEIPRGWVSTYGRIARHVDVPHGARAVGRALATNPFAVLIPCHRAVRADGALGGYRGGVLMKRALLELEGVSLIDGERVVMDRVHDWTTTSR